MGTIIEVGELYESSKYDKYIQVLAIDKEDDTGYTLAILWVDKTNLQTTPGDLKISHGEANDLRRVEL